MDRNDQRKKRRYATNGNILVLEDIGHVAFLAKECLVYAGNPEDCIFHATTLESADYFIDTDPGIRSFKHFIVDLAVPCDYDGYFTRKELGELNAASVNISLTSIKFSGWIWLKRLLTRYPDVGGKVIVLSAYVSELPAFERAKYESTVCFLDKSEQRTIDILREIIDIA